MSTKSGRNNWHRGQPQVKLLQRYNWPVLHIINLIPVVPYESYLGEIPCFRHFVWVRQLADTDCVISIQYDTLQFISYFNHMSENWEVLARRKYTDNLAYSFWIKIGLPIFDTSASAGCRTHTKCRNMESLLIIPYESYGMIDMNIITVYQLYD